jgi:hypothetical protein
MLRSTLNDPTADLPLSLDGMTDFRQRASRHYTLDAGPFSGYVAVNIFFSNCAGSGHRELFFARIRDKTANFQFTMC